MRHRRHVSRRIRVFRLLSVVVLTPLSVLPVAGGLSAEQGGGDGQQPIYREAGRLPTALVADGTARPRCLAEADLDRNGTPDLIVGYEASGAGLVAIHLGDPAAYPTRNDELPFRAEGRNRVIAVVPDWVVAGDFDADGWQDVVVAARGEEQLHLLLGDGRGGFHHEELVELPGSITALAAGDLNRRDGIKDLVLAVRSGAAAALLVFESPRGALRGSYEVIELSTSATDIEVGQLVSSPHVDVAVAAGSEVVLVEGRDRRLSWSAAARDRVAQPTIHRIDIDSRVTGIAIGRMTGASAQLAVSTEDERLELLSFDGGIPHRERVDASPSNPSLVAARIPTGAGDGLLVVEDRSSLAAMSLERSATAGEQAATTAAIGWTDRPTVAVLPMRLNLDTFDDLVVLVEGRAEPLVFLSGANTTFTVNTTDDLDDGNCTVGHCSLREAINDADSLAGLDTIEFSVGFDSIVLTGPLPVIHHPVVIDGLQGVCPTTCFPTAIDGSSAGANAIGLDIDGGGVTLSHLIIHDLDRAAVRLDGDDNIVENCQLGIDRAGDAAGNGVGLLIQNSANNTIGGSTTLGNVLSGNVGSGLHITGGTPSTGNLVTGNFIGTDASGSADIGNGESGVRIDTLATGNTIGNAAAPNVISGNTGGGVRIGHPDGVGATANLVVANFIGLDDDGATILGNGGGGVLVEQYSDDNTIGGTTTGLGNVISGNLGHGVEIRANADRVQVQGNIIGLAGDGDAWKPNTGVGVVLISVDDCLVGGTVTAAGNVISRNTSWGMVINGTGSDAPTGNSVLRNKIGTDAAGTTCRGNASGGIRMSGSDNTIGDVGNHGNLIGCNGGSGISVSASSAFSTTGNAIIDNAIGIVRSGYGELANSGNGITISGAVTATTVGAADGQYNRVAHNGGAGIVVSGTSPLSLPQGTTIRFNQFNDNQGLGIDLTGSTSGDGVTPNDDPAALDGDSGPNGFQNYPVITAIDADADTVTVRLDSATNSIYTVDAYLTSALCDPSAFGEGAFYLGSVEITTDGGGHGEATGHFPYIAMDGMTVTATATDGAGNTSEFSECFVEGEGLVTEYIFSDGFEGSFLAWSDVVGYQRE